MPLSKPAATNGPLKPLRIHRSAAPLLLPPPRPSSPVNLPISLRIQLMRAHAYGQLGSRRARHRRIHAATSFDFDLPTDVASSLPLPSHKLPP
jgi:hypothetical protein